MSSHQSWPTGAGSGLDSPALAPAAPSPSPYSMEGHSCAPLPRPMSLKVLYTFDRSGSQCLARWQQPLQIPAVALDERSAIGIVDLRTCLMAVAQGSPEIFNQPDTDYNVYAYDYSEADVPLVGQGMLSRGLDPNSDADNVPCLTGRVTQNMLGIFGGGSRETLEVKLKLVAVCRAAQGHGLGSMETQDIPRTGLPQADPTATFECNSLAQLNAHLGHNGRALQMDPPQFSGTQRAAMGRVETGCYGPRAGNSQQMPRSASDPPPPVPNHPPSRETTPAQHRRVESVDFFTWRGPFQRGQGAPQSDPTPPTPPKTAPATRAAQDPPRSRPPSRTAAPRKRSRAPTGRPRGRPRRGANSISGNTSAAEGGTDGDDGPKKKRPKIVEAGSGNYNIAQLSEASDSLRVAASTSGSIRILRPASMASDVPVGGGHVQDVPRAPTPIPDMPFCPSRLQKLTSSLNPSAAADANAVHQAGSGRPNEGQHQARTMRMLVQDARSPTESVAHSPDQGYVPDQDSPADLGSSPPVARMTYMQSSPPPSSPVLPALPAAIGQFDSGFMSGDFLDEDELATELALTTDPHMEMLPIGQVPFNAARAKSTANKGPSRPRKKTASLANMAWHEENPGPKELLPRESIYMPPYPQRLTMGTPPASHEPLAALDSPASRNQPLQSAKPRMLQRPHTEPAPTRPSSVHASREQLGQLQGQSLVQQLAPLLQEQEEGADHPIVTERTVSRPASPQQAGERQGQAQELHKSRQPHASEAPTMTGDPALALPNSALSRCAAPLPVGVALGDGLSAFRPTPELPPGPASDPAAQSILSLPLSPTVVSEADASGAPDQDGDGRRRKNVERKRSIKENLEKAIQDGKVPPFCGNCGAIETPTWRKIWTYDVKGEPLRYQLSAEPGCVTAVDILEVDGNKNVTLHRLTKKSLAKTDKGWAEGVLCNPCGIWLSKFNAHRPQDRWEADAARLSQVRQKRGGRARSKRPRPKSNLDPADPTSEPYLATDAENTTLVGASDNLVAHDQAAWQTRSPKDMGLGSSCSGGTATVESPDPVDSVFGTTRRLLFSSPRSDGVPKTLGQADVNAVQTQLAPARSKAEATLVDPGKENESVGRIRATTPAPVTHDDLELELFGTPPMARPSTPPPKSTSAPFRTPTRSTPSHRPITRSISRSIRSVRHVGVKSPSQLVQLQCTPSKTPCSVLPAGSSGRRLRSTPRRQNEAGRQIHAHFALDVSENPLPAFESPYPAKLAQLLSEADDFTRQSSAQELADLDLTDLSNVASDGLPAFATGAALDLDFLMPSSPPLLGTNELAMPFEGFGLWTVTVGAPTGEQDGRGEMGGEKA